MWGKCGQGLIKKVFSIGYCKLLYKHNWGSTSGQQNQDILISPHSKFYHHSWKRVRNVQQMVRQMLIFQETFQMKSRSWSTSRAFLNQSVRGSPLSSWTRWSPFSSSSFPLGRSETVAAETPGTSSAASCRRPTPASWTRWSPENARPQSAHCTVTELSSNS